MQFHKLLDWTEADKNKAEACWLDRHQLVKPCACAPRSQESVSFLPSPCWSNLGFSITVTLLV
eukprot:1330377-Rhodomonas_salina.1